MRRVLASVMLAALVLSLRAGGVAATRDCPLVPGGGAPALVAGMDGGGCEHADAGPCLTALGCVTAAPAIRPAAALLLTPTRVIVLGAAPTLQIGDLNRSGPPTPPPNHI